LIHVGRKWFGWVNGHLFDIQPKNEQHSKLAADCVIQSLERETTRHGVEAVVDLYRPMADLLTDGDRKRIGSRAADLIRGMA